MIDYYNYTERDLDDIEESIIELFYVEPDADLMLFPRVKNTHNEN